MNQEYNKKKPTMNYYDFSPEFRETELFQYVLKYNQEIQNQDQCREYMKELASYNAANERMMNVIMELEVLSRTPENATIIAQENGLEICYVISSTLDTDNEFEQIYIRLLENIIYNITNIESNDSVPSNTALKTSNNYHECTAMLLNDIDNDTAVQCLTTLNEMLDNLIATSVKFGAENSMVDHSIFMTSLISFINNNKNIQNETYTLARQLLEKAQHAKWPEHNIASIQDIVGTVPEINQNRHTFYHGADNGNELELAIDNEYEYPETDDETCAP